MDWIFLSLLAPFVYAINVFIDKYLVESRLPNYRSLPIFSSILAAPIALIFWFDSGFMVLDSISSLLIVSSGALTVWAFSLYLEALIKEDTSLLIILIQLIPVIVLILSYFILGESINGKQLLGFVLLFSASILVSLKKENSTLKFSKALLFVLMADILWSLPYIMIKFVSGSVSFQSLIMYESLGVVLGGGCLLFFIPTIRNAFLKTIKKTSGGDFGLIMINEGLFLSGKILTYMAVIIGPAALVAILGSTQIFYGIIFGVILTLFLPKVFKEDVSRQGIYKKIFLGIMAFVGIILVS